MAARPRRIGLTRHGYSGASLHKDAAARLEGPTSKEAMGSPHNPKTRAPSPDILAPPVSSSDEEDISPKRKLSSALQEVETQDLATNPKKKRAIQGRVTRNKRSEHLAESKSIDTDQPLSQTVEYDPREEQVFNSSQQRRVMKGYGRLASLEQRRRPKPNLENGDGFRARPKPITENPPTDNKGSTFVVPRGLDDFEGKKDEPSRSSLRNPPVAGQRRRHEPDNNFRRKSMRIADPLLRIEVQQAIDSSARGFLARWSPLNDLSEPSSSVETLADGIFTPEKMHPSGSTASSPLSSAPPSPCSSNAGAVADSSLIRCPLCGSPVAFEFYESYNNGRPLKFSDQHRFCHDHRMETARSDWARSGYPTIDWAEFTGSRIKKTHMDTLLQTLYGKRDSHYSSVLAGYAAKGPKALQLYFKEGIVDVVSPGYYGPKGSKIMARTIQERLSKQLDHASRKGDLIRDAGVGGYVQAVLVPELTILLVKEDFSIAEDDEKARQIMNDSLEIGMLLHGEEEDAIVQEDEEGVEI